MAPPLTTDQRLDLLSQKVDDMQATLLKILHVLTDDDEETDSESAVSLEGVQQGSARDVRESLDG